MILRKSQTYPSICSVSISPNEYRSLISDLTANEIDAVAMAERLELNSSYTQISVTCQDRSLDFAENTDLQIRHDEVLASLILSCKNDMLYSQISGNPSLFRGDITAICKSLLFVYAFKRAHPFIMLPAPFNTDCCVPAAAGHSEMLEFEIERLSSQWMVLCKSLPQNEAVGIGQSISEREQDEFNPHCSCAR